MSTTSTRPVAPPLSPLPSPAPEPGRRTELLTLVAMCLGTMMTFLLITASTSALAAISADLRVSPSTLIWIPSAYSLLVASLVLTGGTLGNIYGRKRVFALGVVVMIGGGLVVALAGGTGAVIAGQLLSGAGGALILPNSLAILGATFPDPHRRTEVITAWAASSGIGLAIGPLIAGVLLDHYSWHTVFLSNVVLGLLALAVALPSVVESRAPGSRLDVRGAILGTATIASLVFALIQGGHDGYRSAPVVAAWVLSAVSAVAFVVAERRAPAPMLDMALFASRSFSAVMAVAAVSLFGFTGIAILTVLFYEKLQGLSALDTGWRILAMFGTYVVVAFGTGRVIRRTGFKGPLTVGLVLGGVASIGLSTIDAGSGFAQMWPWLAVFGAACGLVAAPSTAAALVSVDPARAGMASGAVNTARQVGSVMGASLLGSILAGHITSPRAGQSTGAAFVAGLHTGYLVNAVVFFVTAGVALAFVRNRPHLNSSPSNAAGPGLNMRRSRR